MNDEKSLENLKAHLTKLEEAVTALTERLERTEAALRRDATLEVGRLVVRSPGTRRCIMLDADAESAGLYLYDDENSMRGALMVLSAHGAQLEVRNAKDEQVVVLCETTSGEGGGGKCTWPRPRECRAVICAAATLAGS
jgi:hypothetical protein